MDKEQLLAAIQLLLDKGINPEQKDIFGSTPIDWLKSYCTLQSDLKQVAIEKLDQGELDLIGSVHSFSSKNNRK